MVVAFRRHTLLPLDDCLYALQPSIPHLTRSSLHRCLQRHGISRLPDVAGDKAKRQKFKRYPIGYFHIDLAEVRTEEGKRHLFVAIDRTSKFAVAQLVEKANRKTAWEFLEYMLQTVPYKIHTILTDNGIQFAEQPRNRNTVYSRPMRFDMICEANEIEHRLTKPSMDQWPSREDEQDYQRCDSETVPLRQPRSASKPSHGLPERLQLCPTPQNAQRPNTLRIHLQNLDIRTKPIHPKSDPPDAGTIHLDVASPRPYIPEFYR